MTLLGTDISHWQGNVDFYKMKAAGAGFVFIKASEYVTDVRFVDNWRKAEEAKLPRGAYHFINWYAGTAVAQADRLCNLLKDYGLGELPPVADFEHRLKVNMLPKAQTVDFLTRFCNRIADQINKLPIIYTAPSYWMEQGSIAGIWTRYMLWIANYGVTSPRVPAPWHRWTFWQYTDRGPGATFGVQSASIDLNWFNGTQEDFNKLFNNVEKPTPPAPTPCPEIDYSDYNSAIEVTAASLESTASELRKLKK